MTWEERDLMSALVDVQNAKTLLNKASDAFCGSQFEGELAMLDMAKHSVHTVEKALWSLVHDRTISPNEEKELEKEKEKANGEA